MLVSTKIEKKETLKVLLEQLYEKNAKTLPFHGWHHINFVTVKAREFAVFLGANLFLVESAALTHDLNYISIKNSNPEAGKHMRLELLGKSGFSDEEIIAIETIIMDAHIGYRKSKSISIEAQALSDADTLFKALPITPVLFAKKFLHENGISLRELAAKVVSDQQELFDQDKYFYTELAKNKYKKWAKTNIELWSNVLECLDDKDIADLEKIAGKEK